MSAEYGITGCASVSNKKKLAFYFDFDLTEFSIYLTHSTQARFPFAAKTAHHLVFTEHGGCTLDSGGGQFQSLSIFVGLLRPEAIPASSQQQKAAVGSLWQYLGM